MAKFFRRGVSKIKFLPAVAGTSPTRAEITAGTDLSAYVSEISGFQLTNAPIMTPNLADDFTPQVSGEDTVADSSLTLYDDNASTAVRTAIPKGTAGFLILFPYGDVATKRCEKWPVTVTGFNDEWSVGNDPARSAVSFAVTDRPTQNATVPAIP